MTLNKKFKNVGVLMGGSSAEKEVSLVSGEAVSCALKNRGYVVNSLIIENELKLPELLERTKIDCLFITLHGGLGEDGTVQKLLGERKIRYTGSGYKACSLAMDKIKTKGILEDNNLPVPDYTIFKDYKYPESPDNLDLPLVIKPSSGGSSIGLSIVRDKESFKEAFKRAYGFGSRVIAERYIKGKEITVGILEDKVLPVIEIVPKREFYNYEAKYTKGLTDYLVPAPIEKNIYLKVQELALSAHQALGCNYFSRVDMRLDEEGKIFILEINAIPGLTSQSLLPKAAEVNGITFEDLCEKILNSASYMK